MYLTRLLAATGHCWNLWCVCAVFEGQLDSLAEQAALAIGSRTRAVLWPRESSADRSRTSVCAEALGEAKGSACENANFEEEG